METLNALERDVLEQMLNALDDMEGRDGYVSDLAYTLFESAYMEGTLTDGTWKAEQWITNHFHYLREVVEDIEAEWDITLNPFSNPEKFMLQVVIHIAGQLIYESDYLRRGRDEEECDCITYDADTIALIRREWEDALYIPF